jgi:predicted nicotinamide N-methyase
MLLDEGSELDMPMRGERVLEVGCGLGLAGLAAALFASPASVVFCDREPLAIHCALSSAAMNDVAVVALSGLASGGDVKVAGALLDWAEPQAMPQPVDMVIGADVLYDPATAASLANACSELVRGSGHVILCEPSKERALGCRQAFLTAALESGASKAEVMQVPASVEGHSCCVLVVASWGSK